MRSAHAQAMVHPASPEFLHGNGGDWYCENRMRVDKQIVKIPQYHMNDEYQHNGFLILLTIVKPPLDDSA